MPGRKFRGFSWGLDLRPGSAPKVLIAIRCWRVQDRKYLESAGKQAVAHEWNDSFTSSLVVMRGVWQGHRTYKLGSGVTSEYGSHVKSPGGAVTGLLG